MKTTWYGKSIILQAKAFFERVCVRFHGNADFAHLAEAIPHLVWVLKGDGKSIYFNQRWIDYTGVSTKSEAKWEDIIHQDDIPTAKAAWVASLQSGKPYSVEYRIKKTDGNYRWHLTRALPMTDSHGTVVKWFGTCTDIQEQKQFTALEEATERLRHSENFLDSVIENIPAMVFVKDAKTLKFIKLNKAGEDLLGVSKEELIGKSHFDLLLQDQSGLFLSKDREALANQGNIEFPEISLRTRHKGDRTLQVKQICLAGADGLNKFVLGIAMDVTDHKKIECELRASRAETQSVLNAAFEFLPQIVWTAQPDGALDYYNKKWVEYTGMTVEQTHGWGWKPVLHPDDLQNCIDKWTSAVKTGSSYEIEYRFKRASDGTYRWHLGRAVCVKDPTGKTIRWFGTCTDIDDQKKAAAFLEQQVTDSTDALNVAHQTLVQTAKMTALGEMAGGIAHEINNPLAIIAAKAELLTSMVNLPGYDQKEVIRHLLGIESTVGRIASIVSGLKTFSRNGENDPSQTELISVVVDNTLALCREKFKKYGIDLKCNQLPDLFLHCRSVQISQVMLNLLNNAFDAVSLVKEKWVKVDVKQVGNVVELAVTDSGKGISPEARLKIMQPFFTTKPIGHGTGLGLSISKGIIEDHGGSLKLDPSAPYTRFVITLPVAEKVVRAA